MTSRSLLAVVLVSLFSACAEKDPLELLAESRARTEVELKTWVEQTASDERAGAGPAAEPGADGAESAEPAGPAAAEQPDTEESEQGEPGGAARPEEQARTAHLSLLVIDRAAPLELPCLTIDVVFEAGEENDSREVGRQLEVLDISRLKETGGLDIVHRVLLPPEPVSAIGVEIHEVQPDELMSLCEARAIQPAGD